MFSASQMRELLDRVQRLENQTKQIVGAPGADWQGGSVGLAFSPDKPRRKIVRVTEQRIETRFDSTGSLLGQFYTYSWRGMYHDRVSGALIDDTIGNSGYFNLRELNNQIIPIDSIVEITTQEGYEAGWWYVLYGQAPSYSAGYNDSGECCYNCTVIRKILTGVCINDSGTITQYYQYLCFPSGEILFEGCETIENCTEIECPESSIPAGTGCCLKTAGEVNPGHEGTYTVTDFSGITDLNCDGCVTLAATPIVLERNGAGFCLWSQTINAPCDGVATTWTISLVGDANTAGFVTLIVQWQQIGPVVGEVWYQIPTADWDCTGVNVLTRLDPPTNTKCDDWPDTVTVTPT